MRSSATAGPIFITHRFRHHAEHSGYDRLTELIRGDVLDPRWLSRLAAPIPDRVFLWIQRASGMQRYARDRCLLEAHAALRFLSGSRRVFFFLHGEYGYRYLGALPNPRRHRIVATFHLPPSVLERVMVNRRHLAALDRLIILGESQRSFFRRYIDDSRIVHLPHPIDSTFFSPDEGVERSTRCLFVGNYLRDFDLFRATVREIVRRAPEVRILVVARPKFLAEFADLPNTEIRSGLSDVELVSAYRASSVLLLPLVDAVANNTILEALACGVPVVATDVGSVRDYVKDEVGIAVASGTAEAHAEAALRLLCDTSARQRASSAARALAVGEFDLRRIAARVERVLNDVAAEPHGSRAWRTAGGDP